MTLNQHREPVQVLVMNLLVVARAAAADHGGVSG
jgi:hypothetical protein